MIAIVDYGAGNIQSVVNVLRFLGTQPIVTTDPSVIEKSTACILPGVGAAAAAMHSLQKEGLDHAIIKAVHSNKPFLAICIGMQILFSHSQEGNTECLGLLKGEVKHFPQELKSPQIGWNRVHFEQDCPLFAGIANDSYFYFVHSYYCCVQDKRLRAAVTRYGLNYCSAVWQNSLFAVQFHPEKSDRDGLTIYRNFIKLAQEGGE